MRNWQKGLALLLSFEAFGRDTQDPILLTQRYVDGGPICAGCTIDAGAIEITASSDAAACSGASLTYTLDLELLPLGQAFSAADRKSVV